MKSRKEGGKPIMERSKPRKEVKEGRKVGRMSRKKER